MKGAGYQSWITYASDNHEGIKALILARSLRRVLTTRLLTIFVSHHVSEEIKKLLEDEFDRCITIEKKQVDEYQPLSFCTVAKINCWKLTRLKKFVFLDCNCLMLKNSDELFNKQGLAASPQNLIVTSVIVDSPSKFKFEKLLFAAKSTTFEDEQLTSQVGIDSSSLELKIDQKYNVSINLRTNNLGITVDRITIVCFTDTNHPLDVLSDEQEPFLSCGILEKAIFDLSMEFLISDGLYLQKEVSTVLKGRGSGMHKIEQIKKTLNPPMDSKHLEELKDSVAIVGLSFRLPGANNLEEFWNLLINGKDGIIKVPEGRWNENQSIVLTENAKDTHAGFLNCPIDEIDAKFFGLSPMEVSYMDPQQRITLQVMWEALEHAGINPMQLKNSKTGVFGGWWRSDYKEMLQEAGLNGQEFFRTYMGNALGTLTGRISHVLELTGPSIATESGCSTSIVAVDMACKSLLNEDCELALGFGVNLWLHPVSINIMNSVIAADGKCKAFDAKADGFGRAEGCSVLVMKRYSDAVRDGDRVWGLIRGSAVVQEGLSRSLGTPTIQCESLAMERALYDAGVEPKDVSFVETHGTGTPVGDPLEIAAVAKVYSRGRVKDTPLVIGSVKTNIGHTEACSGIAGILKTILAMKHEIIPPHLNFDTLNPEINLESIPAIIPLKPYNWIRNSNDQPRIAGVSSFGITGTDGHVIMQESPVVRTPKLRLPSQLPLSMLKISAKSTEAFDDLVTAYRGFFGKTKNNVLDICYTANVGRGDFPHRCLVIGSDKSEILKKLNNKSIDIVQAPAESPKICFLFTGQGSQYPGMAKTLYDNSPVFKIHFDNCNQTLFEMVGISIKEAIWGDKPDCLSRTLYSQTSIFCIEYCLLKVWESWGVKPDFVLGHSLGEFTAAVASGILTFIDALTLVAERSRLIDNLPSGKMIVVKESRFKVEELLKTAFEGCKNWLDFAAINSDDQTVLAGDEKAVLEFKEFCVNNQVKTHILQSSHAFHSRHMDPILDEYMKKALTITYSSAGCPYISGMDGKLKETKDVNAEYWVRHTKEPVRFMDACKGVLEQGATLFLEMGPQPVLSAIMSMNAETAGLEIPVTVTCLPSLRKNDEAWSTMLSTLGKLYTNGVDINWKNFYQFSEAEIVTLPYYPFQNKAHWFEAKGDRQRPIHALVGAPVPNPSELKLFQNQLNVFSTMYLKDHVIGNTIIMPGAGFLEMCLVAGHAANQCLDGDYTPPTNPVTLEDFLIEGPLALHEHEPTMTQIIITTEDTGEIRGTIYSKIALNKETHKWIRHASASFSPYAVQAQGEDLRDNDTLESVKARCTEELKTEESYDKTQQFGVNFGPTFQNLKAAFKGDQEVYFEIHQPEVNTEEYILHPVIIDAAFQGMAFAMLPDAKQLHVPFTIDKFIWYSKLSTKVSYIHISADKSGDAIGILYDADGKRIATFIGVTFIETTVSTVMSAIEAQRTCLPNMFEDVWRDQLGPWDRRVPWVSEDAGFFSENQEVSDKLNKINVVNPEGLEYYKNHNDLCTLYIIKGFYDVGWSPKLGDIATLGTLFASLNIQPSFERLSRQLLTILAEDGYLEVLVSSLEDFEFKVAKDFPLTEEVVKDIARLYLKCNPEKFTEVVSVAAVAQHLGDVLSGRQDALSILFPEDSIEVMGPAEQYYSCCEQSKWINTIGEILFPVVMEEVENSLKEGKRVLRILEVGAGTGMFTKGLIKYFTAPPSCYEYTYTDISAAFFSKGEKIFENSKIKTVFKTLNIEEDPTFQGFIPHYYDIIIGSFVVHTTKDVRRSVSFLRNLLRPTGCLMLTELAKPHRGMNLVFGLLEGFWHFTDRNLRPHNCEMSADKWEMVFKETDFSRTDSVKVFLDHTVLIIGRASADLQHYSHYPTPEVSKIWLIFCNKEYDDGTDWLCKHIAGIGRNVIIIRPSEENNFKSLDKNNYEMLPCDASHLDDIFKEVFPVDTKQLEGIIYMWGMGNLNPENIQAIYEPYFNLCKLVIPTDNTKVMVLTKGVLSIGDHDLTEPFSSPLLGMTTALQNENLTLSCRCIDLDPKLSARESMFEAFGEIFINDSEVKVAYRGNKRSVCRFVGYKVSNNSLTFPKSERTRLILPSSNAINDLKFGPSEKLELGKNDIEVRIKSFALNFKDVLVVLKPDPMFEDMDTVGIDYSGIITAIGPDVTLHKLGDAVLGINIKSGALPSHIVIPEDLVLPLPQGMTFNEGATLPAVASTVYVCLIEGEKLKPKDTILIHAGSGGVGLCAIQTAQHLNCTIVATAGSARKRAYLKSLGIQYVFNSRNTDYGQQIREALGGQGVDFVLNCLTGTGFKEATLSVCNDGARFIEMSKLNVWTPEEVKELRPDVLYEIIDVLSTPESTMKEYMAEIRKRVQDSRMKSIPYVRFDASEIRSALTFLQKAKHIGKIICVMPEPSIIKGSCEVTMPLFNDQSTYLITGGLGGIGLEVAKWMARSGAKHIVLAGRNEPKEKAVEEIALLKSKGVNLVVMKCDISDYCQCEDLLKSLKSEERSLPTLRGIMHAAGVIADGMYQTQKWEKYEEALNPKIKGGWNLHKLTLDYPLEHFVMFSSAAGLFGSLGQSNHAGANVFLDCLAHYRNSIGLPATSINWGQWGQVGVAANLDVVGVKPMTPLQAVSGLETVIKSHNVQLCVVEANFSVLKKIFPIAKKYLIELKNTNKEKMEDFKVNREEFWREYDSAADTEGRVKVLTRNIRLVVRQLLKLDDSDPIDDNANFQELGMDSMMMIEMKNVLQTLAGDRAKITVNSVKDCTTIAQLSVRIVELVSGVEELPPLSPEELNLLIREDAVLPEHIKATGPGPKPSEVKTVFITGVTGNLGAYILKEIFKQPNIQKVYCLMRGNSQTSPKDRLTKNLTEKNVAAEIPMDKLECVTGSLGKKHFGLTNETYQKLAAEVDCIFHLGVLAHFYEPYRKVTGRERDIRAVNVFGTKSILELAGKTRTKIVYQASSSVAIAVATLDEHKRMSEYWPMISDFDTVPKDAYTISKFIGDLLMQQAVERGIPCKVFRFPMIGGDSKTGGNIDVSNNSLMLRMMAYMHLGCMPAIPVPFMIIPVDQCAEISAKIFFNDATGNEVYNIHNPKVNDEQEVEELGTELGYPIETIDPEEFVEKLERMEDKDVLLILKKAIEFKNYRKQIEDNVPKTYDEWVSGNKIIFQSLKLEKWIPEYPDCMEHTIDVLRRDLMNAKSRGIFTKLGLRK